MKNHIYIVFATAALMTAAVSNSWADEARLEAARAAMLRAAVNPDAVGGKSVEVLCHIVSAEVGYVVCGVFNKSKRPVGTALVYFKGMPPKTGAYLLDNCAVGMVNNLHKPECIVFMNVSGEYGALSVDSATPATSK